MKMKVSALFLIIMMISVPTLFLNNKLAKTEPATIIVPDDCSTIQGAISRANDGDTILVRAGRYNETLDVNRRVSIIGEDEHHTIIDGGYTPYDVIMVYANGVSLSNLTIENGGTGIHLIWGSSWSSITQNTITNNSNWGISLEFYDYSSNDNVISGNNVSQNGNGIHLYKSNNNILSFNDASNNYCGIQIDGGSQNNTLIGNSASNNTYYNFCLFGSESSDFCNSIDRSNLVNGKPIYYIQNVTDAVYDSSTNAGTVYLINCANITLKDLTLAKNYFGVFLWNTSFSTIENVTATNNYGAGVMCEGYSDDDALVNNTLSEQIEGLFMNANDSLVQGNKFLNNSDFGIEIDSCNTTVSNNEISGCGFGIYGGGINCEFMNNSIISNSCAFEQGSFTYCHNNTFFHNNFINNYEQIGLARAMDQSINYWDDGYPSGGNYWSDYNRADVHSGPYQNDSGSDGIGDVPKTINANNTDHYPLMKPYGGAHDIGIASLNSFKTVIAQGCCVNADFKVINYGQTLESFAATLFINSTMIGNQTVQLNLRNSTDIFYIWNTTGYSIGNYAITTCTGPVPGETDTADNNKTAWATVTIPGDINGDFKVNLADLVLIAQAYGSHPTNANWNSNADINGHGLVDLSALVTLAVHYGQHYP